MSLLFAILEVFGEYFYQSRYRRSGLAEMNRYEPRSQYIYKVMQPIGVRHTIQGRISCEAQQ